MSGTTTYYTARYDTTAAAPQPVLGWQDNSAKRHANLPPVASSIPAGYVMVTADQWAQHLGDLNSANWTIVNGAVSWAEAGLTAEQALQALKIAAQAALNSADRVALRCFKKGIVFPAAWQTYDDELRAIVNGSASPMPSSLPTMPVYPAGS